MNVHASPVTIHRKVLQGSDEWYALRLGLLTASEMKLIITAKTLKAAANEEQRLHIYELAAQRISKFVEPHYVGDNMLRGQAEEIMARQLYRIHIAPVQEVGFITNTRHGFTLGYSPDGLVGEDGQIEAKSRIQKHQVKTIVEHVTRDKGKTIPTDFLIQVQTGLLASERQWCDFLSYSGGLPMVRLRVYPDEKVHEAILEAARAAEKAIKATIYDWHEAAKEAVSLIPTERTRDEDIMP